MEGNLTEQGSSADTIFAVASGKGRAGVAVVRLSGPSAEQVYCQLARCALPPARHATIVRLFEQDCDDLIDRAMAIWMPGPQSFTGEDVLELHVHGGTAVLEALLNSLGKITGCREAAPGEFTRRAFEHGKLDLTAAEGLHDLVLSETQSQRRQSLSQLEGRLGQLYEGWRARLMEIVAHVEIDIDFAEEDVPGGLLESAREKTATVSREIRTHLDSASRGTIIRGGFSIVIVGAPNVGKSSLLNALAQDHVAIVSHVAGTTRDSVSVRMDLGGFAVTCYDTAGLRESDDEIEQEGVRRAREKASSADLRILLYDLTSPETLRACAREFEGLPTLLVGNKSDTLTSAPEKSDGGDVGAMGALDVLYVSAQTGEGLDGLKTKLSKIVAEAVGSTDAPVLTRARHKKALEECMDYLRAFLESEEDDPAVLAEQLRMAARALGRITGRVGVEDMLDIVFSEFCIGK